MNETLSTLIFAAGVGQLSVLVASALVPARLNWRNDLLSLSLLHRQLFWVYGGYVVLSIVALALLSIFNATELATGSGLARGVCLYIALFWGVRLSLQCVLDARPYLTSWWLKLGYHGLTILFAVFTAVYGWGALGHAG